MRWFIHEVKKNDFVSSKEGGAWEVITKDLVIFQSKPWAEQKNLLNTFCRNFEDEEELKSIVTSGNEFK